MKINVRLISGVMVLVILAIILSINSRAQNKSEKEYLKKDNLEMTDTLD